MSQIFDALQRSESERSGSDLTELSAAADLLEVAERQVVQFATEGDHATENQQQPENGHQTQKVRVDQFSQFSAVAGAGASPK